MFRNNNMYEKWEKLGPEYVRAMLIREYTAEPVFTTPMAIAKHEELKSAKIWLTEHDEKQKRLYFERQIELSKESNKIAEDANVIAKGANSIAMQAKNISRTSNWIAIGAIVFSLLSLAVSIVK